MTIKRETLVNNAATTLNGSIDASVTTVTVVDGSVFPATGNFRVIVDSEIMKVTSRSVNDLTVVRGSESTTAASHSTAASITAIVTKEAIDQLIKESTLFSSNSSPAKVFGSGTTLDSTDFAWVNQGTAAVIDDSHGITLTAPTNSGSIGFRGLFRTAPSTPYIAKTYCLFGPGYDAGSTGTSIGLGFRESSTGKLFMLDMRQESDFRAVKMTNPSTLSASAATTANRSDRAWLKLADDGTTLTFSVSIDDDTYYELFSETRTTFMAGGPNQIGLAINPYNTSGSVAYAHFLSWLEE